MFLDISWTFNNIIQSGMKYVFVVVNYASCCLKAVALSSLEADTLTNDLLLIFIRMGFSSKILTDYRNYRRQLHISALELVEKVRIKHFLASAYHFQTKGWAECLHRTLEKITGTQRIRISVYQVCGYTQKLAYVPPGYRGWSNKRNHPQKSLFYPSFSYGTIPHLPSLFPWGHIYTTSNPDNACTAQLCSTACGLFLAVCAIWFQSIFSPVLL